MNLTARFEDALVYATRLHEGQKRKGTDTPYVSHLLGVASLVLEHGGDETAAIAGLLHDAAEDQGGEATLEEIRRRFGDSVAQIVDACSDTFECPKPPWRPRKEMYIERMRTASPAVKLVSSADKLHNARAILADYRSVGEALWSRFSGGKSGTLWYYRALVDAYSKSGATSLVGEIDHAISEVVRLSTTGPLGVQR